MAVLVFFIKAIAVLFLGTQLLIGLQAVDEERVKAGDLILFWSGVFISLWAVLL